ncbi:hypothetical protein RNJ44_02298 [Nakaseomyces bracarensis]|uniref:Uncharacterized protein n=1 Tax=Nakaseomyces bracarensis TaxID=273131 RepID=A0ABR4NN92_9SACH
MGLDNIFERSVQDPCCLFEDDIPYYDTFKDEEEEEDSLKDMTGVDLYELRKYNSVPVIPMMQQSSQISLQQSQLQLQQQSRRNSRYGLDWYANCHGCDNNTHCNRSSTNNSNSNNSSCEHARSRSAKNSICYTYSGRSLDQSRSRSQSVVAIPSHLLSIEKYITSELDTNIVPKLQGKKPLLASGSSSGSSSSEFARPPPKRRTSSFKLSLASSFSP